MHHAARIDFLILRAISHYSPPSVPRRYPETMKPKVK